MLTPITLSGMIVLVKTCDICKYWKERDNSTGIRISTFAVLQSGLSDEL
jgi:hypothetical protein